VLILPVGHGLLAVRRVLVAVGERLVDDRRLLVGVRDRLVRVGLRLVEVRGGLVGVVGDPGLGAEARLGRRVGHRLARTAVAALRRHDRPPGAPAPRILVESGVCPAVEHSMAARRTLVLSGLAPAHVGRTQSPFGHSTLLVQRGGTTEHAGNPAH
jgi:hypothetical protein